MQHCPTHMTSPFKVNLFLRRWVSCCETKDKIVLLIYFLCQGHTLLHKYPWFQLHNLFANFLDVMHHNIVLFQTKSLGMKQEAISTPAFLQICHTMCGSYSNRSRCCIQAIGIFQTHNLSSLPYNARCMMIILYFIYYLLYHLSFFVLMTHTSSAIYGCMGMRHNTMLCVGLAVLLKMFSANTTFKLQLLFTLWYM